MGNEYNHGMFGTYVYTVFLSRADIFYVSAVEHVIIHIGTFIGTLN